jgi:hypothetical protein
MAGKEGLEGLTEARRETAERSYAKWAAENPELGRKYDLANYVGYVQDKWDEKKSHAVDLDQLARQMGRKEENRAASQFDRVARPADLERGFPSAAKEATQRPVERAAPVAGPSAADTREKPTTAQREVRAQQIAARLGKITNPARLAAALFKQHKRDATAPQIDPRAADINQQEQAARQAEARRQSQLDREAVTPAAPKPETPQQPRRPDVTRRYGPLEEAGQQAANQGPTPAPADPIAALRARMDKHQEDISKREAERPDNGRPRPRDRGRTR